MIRLDPRNVSGPEWKCVDRGAGGMQLGSTTTSTEEDAGFKAVNRRLEYCGAI